MNRTVRLHLKSLRPDDPDPDAPVFLGGSSRPNNRFRELCTLAAIAHKRDIESGAERPWVGWYMQKGLARLDGICEPTIFGKEASNAPF